MWVDTQDLGAEGGLGIFKSNECQGCDIRADIDAWIESVGNDLTTEFAQDCGTVDTDQMEGPLPLEQQCGSDKQAAGGSEQLGCDVKVDLQ